MNKPKINLKSEIVKIITPAQAGVPGDAPIYRHFFWWEYADALDSLRQIAAPASKGKTIPLRVQLYNATGHPVGNLMAFDTNATSHKYIYVDAPEKAVGFGFHTVSLFKRSQECLDTISQKVEDLTKL